jgi:hypothetical protein
MRVTYAVSWEEPGGSPGSGRLELGTQALTLEGRNGRSSVSLAYPYRDISDFRIAGAPHERLQGGPTLIVGLAGKGLLRIASVAQPGILAEIAHRLGELTGRQDTREREAVVVPLRPGSQTKAEALLAQGPPFDPADFGLERHEVFVTDSEVVFVFEGAAGVFSERLAAEQTVWKVAEAWRPLIAGPIRLGLQAYAWPD